MSNFTPRLVTDTRLKQLLDCYGSESSKWPEDERQAALSLLKGSPGNISYREEIRKLDGLLEKLQSRENNLIDKQDLQSLQQRIIQSLPEQDTTANNSPATLQLSRKPGVWIGSIAASLFVVSLSVGIIHQLLNPGQNLTRPQYNSLQTSNEFSQWAWEDITGEPWVEEVDNEPATLMAFLELDIPVE